MRLISAIALAAILIPASPPADRPQTNWPQWRGPHMDGTSDEKNLPEKWSTEENIAWKLALPAFSGSTPIIWEDRIFISTADGDDIYLWCVDRKTGTMLWKKILGSGNVKMRKQNMSSPSPVVDGKNVYIMTGTGILKAFSFKGDELWSRDIQKDYGKFGLNWGYASSPLMFDDALFVQVLHGYRTTDPSYLLRIDKKTGKTAWRVERLTQAIRESPDSYTTPAIWQKGKDAELIITGGDCVTGHDPATGKELWRANSLNPQNNPANRIVASPVVTGDIILAPTRVNPMTAVRPGGRGDVTSSHVLWQTRNGPDVPTPVTDGTYFYVINDRGIAYCFNVKTGEEVYGGQRIKNGTYSASPVLADGKIYATSEEGVTTVYKAGPAFEVIAENYLNDYTLSSPAISKGQIFIRTTGNLFAIGKK
ncbi:MAG: PQQ-binding-like beta-propeller repeat protein [Acidobacteria bacterium]|nr:PQQ-binding-like beta-propeller repeat protein [Acidobacteriota bacterium]